MKRIAMIVSVFETPDGIDPELCRRTFDQRYGQVSLADVEAIRVVPLESWAEFRSERIQAATRDVLRRVGADAILNRESKFQFVWVDTALEEIGPVKMLFVMRLN